MKKVMLIFISIMMICGVAFANNTKEVSLTTLDNADIVSNFNENAINAKSQDLKVDINQVTNGEMNGEKYIFTQGSKSAVVTWTKNGETTKAFVYLNNPPTERDRYFATVWMNEAINGNNTDENIKMLSANAITMAEDKGYGYYTVDGKKYIIVQFKAQPQDGVYLIAFSAIEKTDGVEV